MQHNKHPQKSKPDFSFYFYYFHLILYFCILTAESTNALDLIFIGPESSRLKTEPFRLAHDTSLQTGQANFSHPAFQLMVPLSQGSAFSSVGYGERE